MNNLFDPLARYAAQVHAGYDKNYQKDKAVTAILVALGWVVFPFFVQTLFHPSHVIQLQYKLQHLKVPHFVTAQHWDCVIAMSTFLVIGLIVLQTIGTASFYRKTQIPGGRVTTPALWPLAALTAGVFGNLAWLIVTGTFDPSGCVVGLGSAAVTIFAEMVCEGLGRDLVLGSARSNDHPPVHTQSW